MVDWLQIKPLYQDRVYSLRREYKVFAEIVESYRKAIFAITESMDILINGLAVLTKNTTIDVREKYIQLDKAAAELDIICGKRDDAVHELEVILNKYQDQRTLLFKSCIEAHPHLDSDEIIELLQEKLIT